MKSKPQPRERTVTANNLSYHVLEWDIAASDTTVVFLHGFLDLAWSFERVAVKLAPHYHVVAPDFRGHGDSGWVGVGGYYYFPDYTADLARLLPQLTRARVFVVGHSMGGTVATYYAGTFPERVHKLVLLEGIGPPAVEPERAPERLLAHIHTVDETRAKQPRPLRSVAAAAERLWHVHPRLDREWAQMLAERATRPAPGAAPGGRLWKYDPLHRTRSPLLFDLAQYQAFVRRIRCPVLLVTGAESEMTFFRDAARQALYANRRVETLAGAGHMLQLDQPYALAELLLEFFHD